MLAALLVALAPAREPALAAAASYVALGDSYASGVGTATYYAESGSCRRGPAAYPVLVAARLGASLSFAACSGAKTGDVLEDQIDAIGPATTYVTVTVGGNDAGFGRVLARCALPWPLSCTGRIAAARRFVRSAIPAKLDAVYHAIRDRAPAARRWHDQRDRARGLRRVDRPDREHHQAQREQHRIIRRDRGQEIHHGRGVRAPHAEVDHRDAVRRRVRHRLVAAEHRHRVPFGEQLDVMAEVRQ